MEKQVYSPGIENTYSLDSLFREENLKNKESGQKYYKNRIKTKSAKEVCGPSGKKSKRPNKRELGFHVSEGVGDIS